MERNDDVTRNRVRLPFLDGIRGLSALYVVFYHIAQQCWRYGPPKSLYLLLQGHSAVTVFIVLSGFSLTLPLASSGRFSLADPKDYIRRRARRILPPYYAALALSLLLLAIVPAARGDILAGNFASPWPTQILPALLAHLFVVHDLNVQWAWRFNGPLWSVGTEWQIYFLFPLLLLPARRMFGRVTTVFAGFAVGLIAFIPGLSLSCLWYAGSFAVGMIAAELGFLPRHRNITPAVLLAFAFAAFIAGGLAKHGIPNEVVAASSRDYLNLLREIVSDILCSLGDGAIILWLVERSRSGRSSAVAFLQTRAVKLLGAISYSLYLVHYPIIVLITHMLHGDGMDGSKLLYVMLPISLAIVFFAYCFHRIFERPFLTAHGSVRANMLITPYIAASPKGGPGV